MRAEADAVTGGLWFAWSCALVFLAGYSLRTRLAWARYPEGRAFAAHGFAFLLLTTPFILRYATGLSPAGSWFGWYMAVSFAASGVVELYRLHVVWVATRGG